MAGAGDLRDVFSKYGVHSLNEKTGGGWTALMNAVAVSDKASVEILLDNGADPEITDDEGRTALHLAAGFAITDMTWLLLERGANMEAVDGRGFTPLLTAKDGEASNEDAESRKLFTDVRRMIETKAADKQEISPELTQVFNRYTVRSVNDTVRGWTALMQAVSADDKAAVQTLIDNGANIEQQDRLQRTALFIAAEFSKPEMVALLLQNGADMNARNSAGKTPLAYAREREQRFQGSGIGRAYAEVISLLEAQATQPPKRPRFLSALGKKWSI